jgi:precorrin-6B methylase 2
MKSLDAGLAGNEDGLAHQSMSDWLAQDEDAEDFSRAQHAGSMGPAMMMADSIDLSGMKTLLDVAGGTGAYSMAFCGKYPELNACIIDFPSVVKTAEGFVNHAGMRDRISFINGDALQTAWPAGQDAVLMSYLLSAVGGGDITPLLQQAWHALKPGGKLILHDFVLEDDRSGPTAAAGFFLSYLTLRTDPVSFTAAELKDWTEAEGFTDVESAVMIPEITKIVTATKPA